MKNISRSKSYLIVAAFWLTVCLLWSTKTQAQVSWCDSLSYTTAPQTTLIATGNSSLSPNMVDSVVWNFTACNAVACYIPQGNNPYSFPLIQPTDTVKLCYDAFIYSNGITTICNHCDSLVYDGNSYSWVLLNMGNPTSITELQLNTINDGKIYDMLGRELNEIPLGQMYIRYGKLQITK
jgi:hypothetical protein